MNVYLEKGVAPKAVPVVVPLAYQAIRLLDQKISEAEKTLTQANNLTEKKHMTEEIPMWKRYSLSVPEAAKYFGIGEKRLYQIIAEHESADFILEIGSHIKIKRELFARFLDQASCV